MSYTERKERAAHIDNMNADSDYKRGLLKYEPWKLVITAFGAGGAGTLAVIALATFILADTYP